MTSTPASLGVATGLALSLCSPVGFSQVAPNFQGADHQKKVEEQRLEVQNRLVQVLDAIKRKIRQDDDVDDPSQVKIFLGVAYAWHPACANASHIAWLDASKSDPMIWICLGTMAVFKDFAHASALLGIEDDRLSKSSVARKGEALAVYYAKTHVNSNYAQAAGLPGETYCTAWNAAYLTAHDLPLSKCTTMAYHDRTSLNWASQLRSHVFKVIEASGDKVGPDRRAEPIEKWLDGMGSDLFLATAALSLAHEISHVLYRPSKTLEQTKRDQLNNERNADTFALRLISRFDGDYEEAATVLPGLLAFLAYVSELQPPEDQLVRDHLAARVGAGLQQSLCEGGALPFSGEIKPKLDKLLKEVGLADICSMK